jgi:omega-6 fatty acid desaturase (delta-12 desaturase)
MQESASTTPTFAETLESHVDQAVSETRQRMQQLVKHCNNFRGAVLGRSVFQLVTTGGAYFIVIALMLNLFIHKHYFLSTVLMLLASGLLVRLFIIQHDCGHGSFFRSRVANDMVGRCISVLTFTPYDFWRRAHALHHAYSGNLNRRGVGSLDTLTVNEYLALPEKERRIYKIYRHPFSQVIVIPILYIFFIQRFPPSQTIPFLKDYHSISWEDSWRSIFALDAALVVGMALMGVYVGWAPLFLCYIPVVMLTTLLGGWLFFIQHQFENSYWDHEENWDFREASVMGSSYYDLPPILQWFSGNIGIHHVHHLCSMIPNYKLQACIDADPELKKVNRLTIRESLRCLHWALWDESKRKMVGFSDLSAA